MRALIHPELNGSPPVAERGEGVYVYDRKGRRYLDGSSGAVVANLGHGIPEILQAMARQASRLAFVYRSQFTSAPAEELAELLAGLAPGDLNHVFFVNSGSEATETALKLALQYWQERGFPGKDRVISRWMSYHGITLGALSMSGHAERRRRFESLLAPYPQVPAPYCYRCPLHLNFPSCDLACADALAAAIEGVGAERVAAFIAEPIVGASGGAITPPEGYYQRVREICDRYQVLFIADEVMTGMGRTGALFALEHWGVVPDLTALGKGLGAGYTPIAAVLVSERVLTPIREGSGRILGGHTLSANPLSTATALAVLRYLLDHDLLENARRQGERLRQGLEALARRHPLVGEIRGKGLLMGLELVAGPDGRLFRPEAGVTRRLVELAFQDGLLIYPAGGALKEGGDAVLIAPPLTIQEDEVDQILDVLDRVLARMEAEGRVSPAAAGGDRPDSHDHTREGGSS